jgi:hypothetical protein
MTTTRIESTCGYRVPWLRNLLRYCCQEGGYSKDGLKGLHLAIFSLTKRSPYAVEPDFGAITVKLNALNSYPMRFAKSRSFPHVFEVQDTIELMVFLTAYVLVRFKSGRRRASDEIEGISRNILLGFRRERERLLARWGEPGPGPIHQETSKKCMRLVKYRA